MADQGPAFTDPDEVEIFDILREAGFKSRQAFKTILYIKNMNPAAAIDRLGTRQEAMTSKLEAQNSKLEAQNSKYNQLLWAIGIATTVLAALIAVLAVLLGGS